MKKVKLLSDFAGYEAGKVIQIDSMTASSLVSRGIAAYDEGHEAVKEAEKAGEPIKKTKKPKV